MKIRLLRAFSLFGLLLLCACSSQKEADSIFYNGEIITVDDHSPEAEAVAVKGGKILYVGTSEKAMEYRTPQTEMVDLKGGTLLPGFIASHTHILLGALVRDSLSVNAFDHPTAAEVIDILRSAAEKGPVLAFEYDPSLMTDPAELNFNTLDAISTKVPILVINKSGHIAYGNRAAFQAAGVTKNTPNPSGGFFERDKEGNLTGVADEVPAIMALLGGAFPETRKMDFHSLGVKAADWYAKLGYTTVTDLGLGLPVPESLAILREVANAPDAPIRIQGYAVYPLLPQLKKLQKQDNKKFKVLGIKIWSDGSLQGYTAAVNAPYEDKKGRGTLNYSASQLEKMVQEVHGQRFHLAVHANGDRAIEETLTAYEKALAASPSDDPRFRVEHATIADPELFEKMRKVKATPSFTLAHIYYWGEVFKDKILGPRRADEIDSIRAAKRLGIRYSFNDDTLGDTSPLFFLQVAVTRKMKNGEVLNPEQTVSIDDAIKGMTLYPAWQSFRENELGSIEVGKCADFVLLDKNPKKVPPDQIRKIRVLHTWLNGSLVRDLEDDHRSNNDENASNAEGIARFPQKIHPKHQSSTGSNSRPDSIPRAHRNRAQSVAQ